MRTNITDEQIQQLAATARPFSLALLSWGSERHRDGADAIELEHQRRMAHCAPTRSSRSSAP